MRFELERGNVDGFAKLLDYHWELSEKVDAGSSNTLIEQIFSSIEELIDGRLVCGAGGGGFLQVILKKGITREDVENRLRFKGITVLDLIRISVGHDLTVSQACEYLSEVGLCARDYIHREVNSSLSGGELKRIEIATSLARSAPLSIFDEPEAGIDLWSFQNLVQVFEGMKRRLHGSILIISHQERILNIADVVLVVADGRIVRQGERDKVLPELLNSSDMGGCRFYQERKG